MEVSLCYFGDFYVGVPASNDMRKISANAVLCAQCGTKIEVCQDDTSPPAPLTLYSSLIWNDG